MSPVLNTTTNSMLASSSTSSLSVLQAISPSLFFFVSIASVFVLYFAISRSHSRLCSRLQHDQVLIDIPSTAWSNQRKQSRRSHILSSYLPIASLGLLAIFIGSLGLARGASKAFALAAVQAIVATLLHFHLGASVIYLISASVPCTTITPFKLWLYSIVLATVLTSATLISFLGPFFSAIPAILAPLTILFFTLLTLPVLTYTLLTSSPLPTVLSLPVRTSCTPSTSTFPPSPTSSKGRDKGKMVHSPAPLIADIHLPTHRRNSAAFDSHSNQYQDRLTKRNLCIFLFCSQLCALLSFAFGICIFVVAPGQVHSNANTVLIPLLAHTDSPNTSEALVFSIVQSGFMMLSAICMMCAFVLHSFSSTSRKSGSSLDTPFTPSPVRKSHAFKFMSKSPSSDPRRILSPPPSCATFLGCTPVPIRTSSFPPRRPLRNDLNLSSTTTSSQMAEDFLNLRDPFASTNFGVTVGVAPSDVNTVFGTGRLRRASSANVSSIPPVPSLPSTSGAAISRPRLARCSDSQPHSRWSADTSLSQGMNVGVRVNATDSKLLTIPKGKLPKSSMKRKSGKKPSCCSKKENPAPSHIPTSPSIAVPLPFRGSPYTNRVKKAHHHHSFPPASTATCTLPTSSSSANGHSNTDMDPDLAFDPEEALLGQLLLRNLDSASGQTTPSTPIVRQRHGSIKRIRKQLGLGESPSTPKSTQDLTQTPSVPVPVITVSPASEQGPD